MGDLLEYSRSDLSELGGIKEARIARICSCLEKELGLPLPDDWYTPLGDRLLGDGEEYDDPEGPASSCACGHISRVIGPVLDIRFTNSNEEPPKIYTALYTLKTCLTTRERVVQGNCFTAPV